MNQCTEGREGQLRPHPAFNHTRSHISSPHSDDCTDGADLYRLKPDQAENLTVRCPDGAHDADFTRALDDSLRIVLLTPAPATSKATRAMQPSNSRVEFTSD
jgi:hypothetical protein